MAKPEINVAVEQVVHKAFADMAQNIADQHGIQVSSVSFDWLDWSSSGENKLFVAGTTADTTCKFK